MKTLKSVAKRILSNRVVRKITITFLSVFFDRKYLRGRHFEDRYSGYLWAFKGILYQKILRFNSHVPWPMTPLSTISKPENIEFHPDDLNNFQSPGCYFQNSKAKIYIGRGTYIGPNVGIITANHKIHNLDEYEDGKDVVIGKNCWIGMNSVILPGVKLGDRTIVGAGSVVTKSFPEGNCVIVGVPARIIRKLGE